MRNLCGWLFATMFLFCGFPAWAATGGPDAFGYTWNDGAPYSWIDAASGTPITLQDDQMAGPYPIGFDFDFYGNTYNTFYVSDNGRIAFVNQPETFNIPCLPSDSPYVGYIAFYWDDFNPTSGGQVFAQLSGAAPNRNLIIEYYQVPHFGSTADSITAEVIISELNGDIYFQYQNPSLEAGANAAVGIMSPDGSTGLSILCHQATLTAGQAIRIDHPAFIKLSTTDNAKAAAPGQSVVYDLTLTNITGVQATIDIAVAGNSWPATPSPAQVTLQPSEFSTVQLLVEVPDNTVRWTVDGAAVTAAVTGAPTIFATVNLVTTAGPDWNVLSAILPTPVQNSAVVTDGSWIYVFSNYLAPGIEGHLMRFDLDGQSEEVNDLSPAINATDGAYLWDNLVFPGGVDELGEISDTLTVYDISDDEWVPGFTVPEPVALSAVVVLDDELYLIGGFDGEQALRDVWKFLPGPAKWRRMASMKEGRIRPVAGVANGLIVVAGGNDMVDLVTTEIYDPAANTWTEGEPMPLLMFSSADCTCNDLFLVIGGESENLVLDYVYAYDPVFDSWFPVSHLQTGRFATEADLLGGQVVVAGGMTALFVPAADAETLNMECTEEIHVVDKDFGEEPDDDATPDDDTADDDDSTPGDDDNDDNHKDEGCCGC